MSEQVVVLFVGGYGRSGSTLLERVLGQIPGFFPVGELYFVWERGLRENHLCGCGEPFHSCEFWNAVGREAFGGWDKVDTSAVLMMQQAADRHRNVPHHVWTAKTGLPSPMGGEHLKNYGVTLEKLYRAIQKVSGARVIVDSSKYPAHGLMLNTLASIDLRLVHLVRDSRAVAYSWTRRRVRPEITGQRAFMPNMNPLVVSWEWTRFNCETAFLSKLMTHSSLLTYEHLVRDTSFWIKRILAELGLDAAHDLRFINGRRLTLAANHTVSGNPMRFRTGDIEVSLDEEWRTKMKGAHKRTVTALTWPLLLRYGYLRITGRQ